MWWPPASTAPIGRCVGQYKQSKFPFALVRDFSGVMRTIGEGVADFRLAMQSLAFAKSVKRVPTPRRSRSRLRSSPRSLTGYRIITPPPRRSPVASVGSLVLGLQCLAVSMVTSEQAVIAGIYVHLVCGL